MARLDCLPGEVGCAFAAAEAHLRFGVSFTVKRRLWQRHTLCQDGQVWAPAIMSEDKRAICIEGEDVIKLILDHFGRKCDFSA